MMLQGSKCSGGRHRGLHDLGWEWGGLGEVVPEGPGGSQKRGRDEHSRKMERSGQRPEEGNWGE